MVSTPLVVLPSVPSVSPVGHVVTEPTSTVPQTTSAVVKVTPTAAPSLVGPLGGWVSSIVVVVGRRRVHDGHVSTISLEVVVKEDTR